MTPEQEFSESINLFLRDIWKDVIDSFKESIQVLYDNQINSVEKLLNAIADQAMDMDVRMCACWLAGKIDYVDSDFALLVASKDENAKLRYEAIIALGTWNRNTPDVIKRLTVALLTDDDIDVRKVSAYSLGMIANIDSLKVLEEVLNNQEEDVGVRGQAAESLADFHNHSVVPSLINNLSDKSAEVRFWCAYTLGQIGAKEALPTLTKLVGQDHAKFKGSYAGRTVSQEAEYAIEAINQI